MVVYSFYIFDRHGTCLYLLPNPQQRYTNPAALIFLAECIYKRRWVPRPSSIVGKSSRPTSETSATPNALPPVLGQSARTTDDDAKLIFGTVFSLRNMVRKLGGEDDR